MEGLESFKLEQNHQTLHKWAKKLNFVHKPIPPEQAGYEVSLRARIPSELYKELIQWLKPHEKKFFHDLKFYKFEAHMMCERDFLLLHHDNEEKSWKDQILLWIPMGPFEGRELYFIDKPNDYREEFKPEMGKGLVVPTTIPSLWHGVNPHRGGCPVITVVGYVN